MIGFDPARRALSRRSCGLGPAHVGMLASAMVMGDKICKWEKVLYVSRSVIVP